MNFIKRYFIKRYIFDNKKVRDISISSLRNAKNVGILCNITTEDTYKDIYAVFSKIQTTERNAWLIGYIDDKNVPFYCLQQLSADYFCNKDLNWYGKPEKGQIIDFMDIDFDILIDFSHEAYPPLQVIMALSKAHLIIGSVQENAPFYDILINSEYGFSNTELLHHVDTYTHKLSGN